MDLVQKLEFGRCGLGIATLASPIITLTGLCIGDYGLAFLSSITGAGTGMGYINLLEKKEEILEYPIRIENQ